MDCTETPESSNISQFCYDADNSTLIVTFKNGSTYNYYDVPNNIYEGMKGAPSKGSYLAQYVKGHYRYARA